MNSHQEMYRDLFCWIAGILYWTYTDWGVEIDRIEGSMVACFVNPVRPQCPAWIFIPPRNVPRTFQHRGAFVRRSFVERS